MDESDRHLCVVLHGLWGSPAHCSSIVETLSRVYDQRRNALEAPNDCPLLHVLCPKANESDLTYDGIDVCGSRIVEEIDAYIRDCPGRVTKFSILGYSLGGLFARYVVGLLESRTPSFFDTVEPINFTTFASPALGVPRFPGILSGTLNYLGARLLSSTGEQLYASDDYLNGQPLVEVLAQPGTSFHTALTRFKSKKVFANAVNDRTVPFASGGFPKDYHDPFARADRIARTKAADPGALAMDLSEGGLHLTFEPDCRYIIASFTQSKETDEATAVTISRIPRIPALPFFLRPSTFKAVPYRLGYVIPFLMPVLLPSFVVYVGGRFAVQSRSSRRRIAEVFSSSDLTTPESRLRRVGLALEDTFEEIAEDAFPVPAAPQPDKKSSVSDSSATDAILTPAQKRMSDNLNAIQGLEKYYVYLCNERNSHGAIIARDTRWEGHEKGLEVLQWWAERFLM